MIPDELAVALRGPQGSLLDHQGLRQVEPAFISTTDAPPWIELNAADIEMLTTLDEAIIETFVVDEAGITALSDSPWLDRWKPRAKVVLAAVRAEAEAAGVEFGWPGHMTCSITPTHMLEGLRHFDYDQLVPSDGVGVVAVCGQHQAPRVATGHLPVQYPQLSPKTIGELVAGPLVVSERDMAAARWHDAAPDRPDDIVMFGGFGQLHAGPRSAQLGPTPAPFRQLIVLRIPTRPTTTP